MSAKPFILLSGAYVPWVRLGIFKLCPDSHIGSLCTRRRHHGGRHASISIHGVVYDVWGCDVHATARAVGRAAMLSEGRAS